MTPLENHMVIGDYYDESTPEPRDCIVCHSELAEDEGPEFGPWADMCDCCVAYEREKERIADEVAAGMDYAIVGGA